MANYKQFYNLHGLRRAEHEYRPLPRLSLLVGAVVFLLLFAAGAYVLWLAGGR